MRSIITFFLLFSFTTLTAQEKYLIYFKDKGIDASQKLSKILNKESLAQNYLSQKSIDRRKRNLGENFFTTEDLPVNQKYIDKLSDFGVKIIRKLKWFNAVSAFLTQQKVDSIISLEFVDRVERVRIYRKSKNLINSSIQQTGLKKVSSNHSYNYGNSLTQNALSHIPEVHDIGITGEGVIIGILDSGFDWENHPSLRDREVIAEFDFVYQDSETANDSKDVSSSQHNHGTSVFSIMAGFDEGTLVGPAFNSKFILAKTEFVPSETHVEEDNFAAALEWMDSIGVDITSSSLGYNEFDAPEFSYSYSDMDGNTTIVTKASELAFQRGISVITSAGNEGNKSWKFITAPGDGEKTLTIGAVNSVNNLAAFSSRGPTADGRTKPEVVAQGVSVYRALASSSGYSFGDGTSFSAPIVSGIAALLLSAHQHLTNEQIREIIIRSGDNHENPNNNIGYGLVSALDAITFPNIFKSNNEFVIKKIFADSIRSRIKNAKILYIIDNKDFITIDSFLVNSSGVFSYELPQHSVGSEIEFSIEAFDSSNNLISKEPEDGSYTYEFGEFIVNIKTSPEPPVLPNSIILEQNFPNPFNSETRISFFIPQSTENPVVSLRIFDVLGREVAILVDQNMDTNENHTIGFSSSGLSSGVYFYQLQVDDFIKTKKLTILK